MIDSGEIGQHSTTPVLSCSSIVLIVRQRTNGFKETNVNVMKTLLNLFASVCQYHESVSQPLPDWIASDCVTLCTSKISDKKLVSTCKELLTSICVVSPIPDVIDSCFTNINSVKSPVAKEEFFKWFASFCNDFGVRSINSTLGSIVPIIVAVSAYLESTHHSSPVRVPFRSLNQQMSKLNGKVWHVWANSMPV